MVINWYSSLTNKLSDKDKKDWQDFLNSSEKLDSKDVDQTIKSKILERSIDLHGYTLDDANKEISNFIENCYLDRVKKINVITTETWSPNFLHYPNTVPLGFIGLFF